MPYIASVQLNSNNIKQAVLINAKVGIIVNSQKTKHNKFLTVMSECLFKGPHRVGYGPILSTEIKHCDVVISSPSTLYIMYSEQLSNDNN